MPDYLPCLGCFGFVIWILPLVLCVVLFSRLAAVTARLQQLEVRLGDFARDILRRPAAAVQPARAAIPLEGERAAEAAPVAAPAAEKPAVPHAPTIPFTPPVWAAPLTPQGGATAASPAPAPTAAPAPTTTPGAGVRPTAAKVPAAAVPHAVARPASLQGKGRGSSAKQVESYIFVKLFVVVGAVILALAAIFLVKIGFDRGIFNKQTRDIAGFSTGLALIVVGQWRRPYEGFWSQGSTAAGIISLFASVFAATTLHGFLTPLMGFIILALATAAAVAMSLQNWAGTKGDNKGGMLIATLGLIGGFITPILVNTGHDNVPGLFGYLLLLHVGLVASTRVRGWSILAAASTILSSVWLLLWTLFKWDGNPADGTFLGTFMLGSVVALVIATMQQPEKWSGGKRGFAAMSLTWLAVALSLLSACTLLGRSHFEDLQWGFFGLLMLGAFFLARVRPVYEGMAWLASFTILAMLTAWVGPGHETLSMVAGGDAGHLAAELARAGRWMIAFGLAGVLGCYVCMWRSAVPLRWAVLGCVLAVGYVLTAYWILPAAPRAEEWAWVPVITASGLALLAVPVFFRRAVVVTAEETLAAFALAILALLVAAAPMAWRHAPLTAAWAALLPLTAVAAWRLRVPGLLIGFVSLCALLICRAFLILPLFDGVDGRTLFWNPVVWAYGSLLVATALSAVIVERIGAVPVRLRGVIPPMGAVSSFLQACATTAAFMLFTLLVHWHYHNGRLDDITALLLERGTFVIGWLILAAVLLWLGDRLKRAMLVMAGQVVGVVALVFSVAILVLFANPLWSGDVLGSGLFLNELLLVYGMPAALCAVVAVLIESIPGANRGVGKAAGVVGFLLLFMLVTLQIRHGYAGEGMHSVVPTFTEWSTYTVAWMGLGIASLAIGLRFGRELPQKAGTILVTLGLLYVMIVPGFLMNPVFHAEAVGPVPVFNLLLYGYGVPIVLAAVAGVVIHPRMARFLGPALNGSPYVLLDLTLGGLIRAGICILVFILLTTEIRQYFQGTWLNGDAMTFVERATYPIAWFALAGVFLAVARRVGSEAARVASSVVAYIAIGTVLLVVTLMMNPLVTRESVGGTLIFNGLLYAYGIPAAATAGLAIFFWKRPGSSAARAGERVLAWVSAIASLLLIFTLVTLEVQHLFRGDHLRFSPGPPGEFTAYSLAWCVLGAVYLVTGIFTRSALLRWASLLMLSLTILKVFLMDMADLKDFERVLSFGGLGLSLMALAFIYQRFVFRRPQAALAGDSLSAEAGASDLENQDPDGAL